jgi:raffinose/stachyose/melibiose transport system substrate-binding protein
MEVGMRSSRTRGRLAGALVLALAVAASTAFTGCEIIGDIFNGGKPDALALANLSLSSGGISYGLTPIFNKDTLRYSATVPNAVNKVTVVAMASGASDYVTINGATANSADVNLNVGDNAINVVAVAGAGSATRAYTVTVTRQPSGTVPSADANLTALSLGGVSFAPAFAANTLEYTAAVPNSTTSVDLSVTRSSALAIAKIASVPGTSWNLPLSVGDNVFNIIVTAENASIKTYKVTVTRAPNTIVVDLLAWGNASDANDSDRADVLRWVGDFEAANPTIDIQYELLRDQAYYDRLDARLAANDPPDLVFINPGQGRLAAWAASGQAVDMRAYLDAAYYDLAAIGPMGPSGEIYYVPRSGTVYTTVLYMNTALSASLGLGTTPPATYDGLKAMVAAAQTAGKRVIAIGGADGWMWQSCLLSTVLGRLSGEADWIAKATTGTAGYAYTDPDFVNSMAFIETMLADGVIEPSATGMYYNDSIAAFNAGNALFLLNGSWSGSKIDSALAANVVLAPFPSIPGQQAATAGSSAGVANSGYGLTAAAAAVPAVRNAALAFIAAIHDDAETANLLRYGSVTGSVRKNFPAPADLSPLAAKLVAFGSTPRVNIIDSFLTGDRLNRLNWGLVNLGMGFMGAAELGARMADAWTPTATRTFDDFQGPVRPWYAVTNKGGALTAAVASDGANANSLHGTYLMGAPGNALFVLDWPNGWDWNGDKTLSLSIDNVGGAASGLALVLNTGSWNDVTKQTDLTTYASPTAALGAGVQTITFQLDSADWSRWTAPAQANVAVANPWSVLTCGFQLLAANGVSGGFRIDDIELTR